ncbi:L-seryl-tRNA(Sec) selenium transferase [Robertmurraya massiliosenegalensis]|uniref:L-seryl-tRNA(Sec) selenium transferase n=1 Tax=Robertmurraya TaxID=2837507 RepID=UPI0039A4A960
MKETLRNLPPIHELQKDARFLRLIEAFGIQEGYLTALMKETIENVRKQLLNGNWDGPFPGNEEFIEWLFIHLQGILNHQFQYTLKRVINGTGTILHTNLGRARLSSKAIEHVLETAQSYSNLEYNLEEGQRGSRHSHVENLIKNITGAEAAMVVNNNAAAVYLVLRELAEGKEVIVSRGELVEIGGSFRISSIMEESGATLAEVGTTNKTHLYDYERALNESTSMIMKVHTSNFKVIGFTKSVPTEELAALATTREDLIFYEDLGSGALYDYQQHGIGTEPVVAEVLKKGVDLVSFSGDKLLGGPQAGIIVGKKHLIERLKKNQLARVVRVDKMTLAALEGTLMDYLLGEEAIKNIPVVRDLLTGKEEIKERALHFKSELQKRTDAYTVDIIEGESQVGGGTMPEVKLPTFVLVLQHHTYSAEKIATKLRTEHSPSIIVRIQKEETLIDLRCVTREEENILLEALVST